MGRALKIYRTCSFVRNTIVREIPNFMGNFYVYLEEKKDQFSRN